ncbi:MAG TPA: DUF4124 domain-containing protein [Steroidobacter sp.]
MQVAVVVLGLMLSAPIYRCTDQGGTVYSDRPCAENAAPHEIDDSRVTVYTPVPTESRAVTAKPTEAKRAKAGRLPDPAKHEATCAKLEQGLRDVRTKMRTGYGAKEGERLKERQRQLDRRRRTEKCR